MALLQQPSQQQRQIGMTIGGIIGLALLASILFFPIASGPGFIMDGANSVLNPDGGSFMSSVAGDGAWTIRNNEYQEFEVLAGSGGVNRPWQLLENPGDEPSGDEDPNDLAAGGNCGNTDITTDSDGGKDYAYFSVIDPDGIADNGDEILALAIRLADEVSGAFSFSFLVDVENNCGADPNATCGNPCFEYEIQIESQKRLVALINIDGCSGTADCDALHGTPASSNKAYVCNPCNTGAIQVEAGSGACTGGSLTPVFWMAHIPFSEMSTLNSTDDFRLVPATTTSGNSLIYKNTNVSDTGGIGDPNSTAECDCTTLCATSSCSECERDCGLACASKGGTNVLPVEWLGFEGNFEAGMVFLNWTTAKERNNEWFQIERSFDGNSFEIIGQVNAQGNSDVPVSYQYADSFPHSESLAYRIKQVDINGKFSYSSSIELEIGKVAFQIRVQPQPAESELAISIRNDHSRIIQLRIMSITGVMIHQEQVEVISGVHTMRFPFHAQPDGIYILQMSDLADGLNRTHKFRWP